MPASAVDARTVTCQVLRTAQKRDESTCIDGMFSQEWLPAAASAAKEVIRMHPREGWTEDRRAGGLSRRGFLKQGAAAGLLTAGAGSLLAGCSSGGTTTSGAHAAAGGIPLP